MRKAATLGFLLALALALPPGAAARTVAPPGNSEADQYFETLPASNGPRAPDPTKKARDAVREGSLSETSEHALRQRGPRGLALATAVARTAPPGTVSRDRPGLRLRPPASTVEPPSQPGMGAAFPLVLAATAAGAFAFAVSRRRSRPAR